MNVFLGFLSLAAFTGQISAGCTYEEFEDSAIYGANYKILTDTDLVTCQRECDAEDFACKSVEINSRTGTCFLSHENRASAPDAFGPHRHMDYYEKVSCGEDEDTEDSDEYNYGSGAGQENESNENEDITCLVTKLGKEYMGDEAVTANGRTCQRWTSQYPHEHTRDAMPFPDGSPGAAANHCRNPDGEPEGPWCYTTDPGVRWEYCDIPYCYAACRVTKLGKEFIGDEALTVNGRTCQRWTSQYPHEHTRDAMPFPDGSPRAAANHCRNPDGEPEGPWCYTTDPGVRWEYCNIPYC